MAIKVQFPVGEPTVTVRGLYQWDYGQVLEIECAEIGSEILEAHFACPNMSEAIVRTCTFSNGFGTVTIPDECLEQTGSLTVWLCRVDSTQRHTIKAITLPLTTRTRPNNTRDVPADYTDKYGQLIEEVNEAINALENGEVTAAKALSATTANHANTAGSATSATYATSSGSAGTVNKYLHNVKINISGSDGEGELALQIITTSQDTITKDNLVQQISAVGINSSRGLPCSGYFKFTHTGLTYSVITVGFRNSLLYILGYASEGATFDGSISFSQCTVAYDVKVAI